MSKYFLVIIEVFNFIYLFFFIYFYYSCRSFIEELEIDINIDNKNSILLQDLDVSNQYLESEMLNSFDNYRNNKSLKFNQILGEVASQMSTINEVCTKHQNNFQYQNLSSYENKNHNHSLSTSVFTSNSELLSTPINQISSKVENKFLNESLESNILNEIENHHNNNHNHNHYNHHLPSRLFRSTSPSTPPSPPPPIITTTTSFFQEKLKKETLDSPSNLKKDDIQNNQRKSLNSSTHFLVPGGLSTNRPLLSPLVSSKHRLFQEQNLNDKK